MLLLLIGLPAFADEPGPLPPLPGLADLHFHQWAQVQHAGQWYQGDAAGPAPTALNECAELEERRRDLGPTHVTTRHGVFFGGANGFGTINKWGFGDERSDDVRLHHPPEGVSSRPSIPHWLGWPTSDSIAHQQGWEGWLRLAHDGLPALYWVGKLTREAGARDIDTVLDEFYRDYPAHVQEAQQQGFAGLNLVVVSLVNSTASCRALSSDAALKADPFRCSDMRSLTTQYEAATQWAAQNASWVEIVTTPKQASDTILAGRLAIVLSLEASDIFGPLRGDDDYTQRAATIRGGLESWLDDLPLVSTLQPAHQLDNPFAGAAFIQPTLVTASETRIKEGHTTPGEEAAAIRKNVDPDVARCTGRAFSKATTEADMAALRGCWRRSLGRPWKPNLFDGIARLVSGNHLPGWFKADGADPAHNIYTNPYGLSLDGAVLVDVLVSRKMPIDIAHLSWKGIGMLVDHLRTIGETADYPIYASHAYPFQGSLIRKEQSLDLDLVTGTGALAPYRPLIGLRPGDDEYEFRADWLVDKAADLDACQGTSVGTRAFVHQIHGLTGGSVAVTFGTDINGFINQTRPVGQLQPGTSAADQCGTHVVDIGSEVRTRGLAHIGLLPSLYLEMLINELRDHAPGEPLDGATGIASGADAYVRRWNLAYTPTAGADPTEDPRAAATRYAALLFDHFGETDEALRTIRVPNAVGAGRVDLPYLRAIEGALPYHRPAAPSPRDDDARTAYPSLPVSIGLTIGSESFEAWPETYQFPVERCRKQGIVDPKKTTEACAPLAEQARRYATPGHLDGYATSTGRFRLWDRELADPWEPDDPLPAESTPARRVHAWLAARDDRNELLALATFENAPVPGLGGYAPREYLRRVLELGGAGFRYRVLDVAAVADAAERARLSQRVHATPRKDREGLIAYCELLTSTFPEAAATAEAECAALRSD